MARKKTVEDLQKMQEKLEHDLMVKKQSLLEVKKKAKELERNKRTHRLCTHGAMLEQYLSPVEFTDEQISSILQSLFTDQGIISFLNDVKRQSEGPSKTH